MPITKINTFNYFETIVKIVMAGLEVKRVFGSKQATFDDNSQKYY